MVEPDPEAMVVCVWCNGKINQNFEGSKLKNYQPWRTWQGEAGYAVILQSATTIYAIFGSPRVCKVYPDLETAKVAVEMAL